MVFWVVCYTWYRKTKNLSQGLVPYLTCEHRIKPLTSKRLHSGIERGKTDQKADNMQQNATDEFT